MLAARMVQLFDFSEPALTERLGFEDGDFAVGAPVKTPHERASGTVDIIDLDGTVKTILHPGNASDVGELIGLFLLHIPTCQIKHEIDTDSSLRAKGPPGMTAANIPVFDFACKLTPRKA